MHPQDAPKQRSNGFIVFDEENTVHPEPTLRRLHILALPILICNRNSAGYKKSSVSLVEHAPNGGPLPPASALTRRTV
jgi:hypothetical protein